jgi:putative tryptophan/tyrosine transport system substrate-binding protein
MHRRTFFTLLPCALLAAVHPVVAQQKTIPRIGYLRFIEFPPNDEAFRRGLRELGYVVRTVDEVEAAFRAAVGDHADAMMVLSDNFFFSQQDHIVDIGKRYRLPEMFDTGDFVKVGGLISYGANLADLYQRSAVYVDKILKGASPANLPVEQATKFELFVNLKTAKALGITIPQSVLLRADQVIE